MTDFVVWQSRVHRTEVQRRCEPFGLYLAEISVCCHNMVYYGQLAGNLKICHPRFLSIADSDVVCLSNLSIPCHTDELLHKEDYLNSPLT